MPKRHIITIRKANGQTVTETVQGRNQQEGRKNVKTPGTIIKVKTTGV